MSYSTLLSISQEVKKENKQAGSYVQKRTDKTRILRILGSKQYESVTKRSKDVLLQCEGETQRDLVLSNT